MQGKIFKFGKDARDALFVGVDVLCKAVTTTLGPKGRNVALDKTWIAPTVLHDGVSVAKDIDLKDPFANMGAQLVKEAASKTNDKAGDGTTTATLLAHSMIKMGMEKIDAGANPMTLKKGIDKAVDVVVKELEKIKRPADTREAMYQVAAVSSASDEIGSMVAEAMQTVGKLGVVTVEDGNGVNIELKTSKGMEIDKGYASPRFVTNEEKMEVDLETPYILVTDQRITSASDLVSALKKVTEMAKRSEIVIIADGYDEPVMATMILNKIHGGLNIVALNAPGFADRRKQILEDIAVVTGATFITKDSGITLDKVELEHFGRCERFFADKDKSQFIGGTGEKDVIDARILKIQKQIEKEGGDFEKDQLKNRVARLSGGVAVIKVGAQTEIEMKERKERVIDAVEATKSAVEEGVIAGGGIALLYASEALKGLKKAMSDDVMRGGVDIVYFALSMPIRKLLSNAGQDVDDILDSLRRIWAEDSQKAGCYGFDVEQELWGDMFQMGILDPKKVTKSALQNAASVSSMILTTDVLIASEKDQETSN